MLPKILPGAQHLISYHVVTEGRCFAGIIGAKPIAVEAGEVIVFTKGDPHVMSSSPGMRANPVTHLVEWYRAAFSTHVLPTPASALYLTVTCVAAALCGAALFAKARPHFADLM